MGDTQNITDNDLLMLSRRIHFQCTGRITISIAESCTGGLISSYLTEIPGASEYFVLGIVSYSNEAKTSLLNVASETMESFDVVSEEVATEMAHGCMQIARSDIALAVTGVTGPGKGRSIKSVGTVCFCIKTKLQIVSLTYEFTGDRQEIRYAACQKALELILENVEK